MRLLVADDDPGILELIMEYLDQVPTDLFYAPNGQRAVELALEEQPDLIIMDWEMPILNGIEAVHRLKDNPITATIPIIISTGVMLEPSNLKEALDSGAVDYMRKPLHPVEFKARINANLRLKSQHQEILRLLEREKLLMSDALARKDRELTTAALNQASSQALMGEIILNLNALISQSPSSERKALMQLRNGLNARLNLESGNPSFFKHFEQVHPNFFNKLKNKYPSISQNDQRLCAYLRIGLSNKEIATISNVESSSVRKSLTRLKKKINLGNEDDLRHYISQV
jgi:DNA-binding response OmpR family regulator/DNA-binding CsgD family transcriptional regulator